jgi:WhiB family transcriptional regulator, redox-sensing transcriptional regulator
MTEWRHFAICRDEDPETFYPADERSGSEGVERARAVCARCPVISDCRAWALAGAEPAGVWGGLSTPERDALLRRRFVPGPQAPKVSDYDAAPRDASGRVRARCPHCSTRQHVRHSGLYTAHLRTTPSGRQHCPGSGEAAVFDKEPADAL